MSGLWPAVLRAACSASAFSRSFSSWLLCTFMFSPSLPSYRSHSSPYRLCNHATFCLRRYTSAVVDQQTSVACSSSVECTEHFHVQGVDINLGPLRCIKRLTFCMAAEAAVWRM